MSKLLSDIVFKLNEHNLIKHQPDNISDINIYDITYNSQDARPGSLFSCKGNFFKKEYLFDAIEKGAVCYVSETVIESANIPAIIVSDIRIANAIIALVFTDYVYKKLKITGLTGTKGKTTTTFFIRNILDSYLNKRSAVLSTVEVYTGDKNIEAHLTTPEPFELHKHFQNAVENDIEYLTMEVSSQAYLLNRVYGINFNLGIFLNISEDHIGDLEHPTYENYLKCKLEFVKNCEHLILSNNTNEKEFVLKAAKKCKSITTFGLSPECDIYAYNIKFVDDGLNFDVQEGDTSSSFRINMAGRFNIENALAAIATARHWGIPDNAIKAGLENTFVPGRMNIFKNNDKTVIVDYAHNYLSFSKLYESLKLDYPDKKIITVFGCPGGHAQLRRRDLGMLAGQYSDLCYLTAEDPQFENVDDICQEIAQYLKEFNTPYEIIEDRKTCIETAISLAKSDDIVILAAKGEELYQKVCGKFVPYESDIKIAKRLLNID